MAPDPFFVEWISENLKICARKLDCALLFTEHA
jgi:hypothetical protein